MSSFIQSPHAIEKRSGQDQGDAGDGGHERARKQKYSDGKPPGGPRVWARSVHRSGWIWPCRDLGTN